MFHSGDDVNVHSCGGEILNRATRKRSNPCRAESHERLINSRLGEFPKATLLFNPIE
jgi:hypothetical protein